MYFRCERAKSPASKVIGTKAIILIASYFPDSIVGNLHISEDAGIERGRVGGRGGWRETLVPV